MIMKKEVERRIELFKKGYSIKEVSEITGNNYKTVEGTARFYRKRGLKVFKHINNPINEMFFDKIDSEIKSYLLGFFLADGCIDGSKSKNGNYSNRLLISNSIDDKETVVKFQKEICPLSKIHEINNQSGVKLRKLQLRLRWTSFYMTNILINKYNFSRRKAYDKEFTFPFKTIPNNLIRHFIRGFFDGDGSVDFATPYTKGGVKSSRFQYGFICTSLPFAEQLSEILCKLSEGISGTITKIEGKTTHWFVLRFNTKGIKSVEKRYKFYEYLYKDSNVYLSRKKIKFDSFFEYRGKQII